MAYWAPSRLVVSALPRSGHLLAASSRVGAAWRGPPVNLVEREPIFLTICWELPHREEGRVVIVQAVLCLAHRREIALKYSSARGCGQFGDSCDLCEARQPRRP
jgi:hypothetical protein